MGTTEHLERFFDAIAQLSFWRRVFGWGRIRSLSYEAFKEFALLKDALATQRDELDQTVAQLSVNENELENARNQQRFFEKERTEAQMLADHLRSTIAAQSQDVTLLREREVQREAELQSAVTSLRSIQDQIAAERNAEYEARDAEARERMERMRNTWRDHEQHVRERLKLVCQRLTVQYIDVVPFRGSPDNTVLVADEYVVFDAKSPANDDLRNFPTYIKGQAEAARKYAKEERVRRDVYFVVPSNTLPALQTFVYNFQDHNVYVIAVDALEPILLSLRRIQDYEFAEHLSPEERENIVRIIARFMHMTKRRIQVDAFFSRQFLDALSVTESELQDDLLTEVHESERTLKLNPPQDQRSKLITREELQDRQERIEREIEARGLFSVHATAGTIPEMKTTEEKSGEKRR